jgi:hypothetical protein
MTNPDRKVGVFYLRRNSGGAVQVDFVWKKGCMTLIMVREIQTKFESETSGEVGR